MRDDRGAVIIEAALVTPLFLVLILAFMELTVLFKDNMSVKNSAHDAAREASSAGAYYDADFAALAVARKSLGPVSGNVERVVIFKATTSSATVPANCKSMALGTQSTGSVADSCNVYTGTFVMGLQNSDRASFGDTGTGTKLDQWYPALQRQQSRGGTAEYIGIYIKTKYKPLTKVAPTPANLESTSIIPIEPRTA